MKKFEEVFGKTRKCRYKGKEHTIYGVGFEFEKVSISSCIESPKWVKFKDVELIEEEKDYTQDKAFWERLKIFVKDIQVNDAMSEEEKEMILHVCDEKL